MSAAPHPAALAAVAGLATPWGLLALLALPVLAWLYRRRPQPPAREQPSLLFLEGEAALPVQRQARRVDPDLLLACAAAALLALAAATPVLGSPAAGRLVRVVVAGGVPSTQAGYAARVEAALAEVRAGLAAGDRLEVLRVPDGPGSEGLARPSAQALLAAARAGAPGCALVVSDLRVAEGEVLARPVGDATLGNVGFVAVARHAQGQDAQGQHVQGLHVLVRNDSPREARSTLLMGAQDGRVLGEVPLLLAPGEVRALALPGPGVEQAGSLWLQHAAPARDALAADDRVGLAPARLSVQVDPALPAALGAAVRAALEAVLGAGGVVDAPASGPAGLRVLPLARLPAVRRAGLGPVLALAVPAPGEVAREVPAGPEQRSPSALVRDVSLAGLRLWRPDLPPGVPEEGVRWLLARAGVGCVGEAGDGAVLVALDLLAGASPVAGEPAWPLLVDNLVRGVLGAPAEGEPGLRVQDLHAPESTLLGRARCSPPRCRGRPAPPRARAARHCRAPPAPPARPP
ncbi:MAG: BatA domain-containing protein, partial [Planctomycetia bacterium]